MNGISPNNLCFQQEFQVLIETHSSSLKKCCDRSIFEKPMSTHSIDQGWKVTNLNTPHTQIYRYK